MAAADYVDCAAALETCVRELQVHTVVAIDTEFIRERTYYPELCLIQIAAGETIWCIDTIAIDDLSPLFDALYDARRLKVIHSGRQDLEIFFNETGRVPQPLFDTQIAASLLGRPDQIAYAGLVAEIYSLELDKTSSRTNWAQRPLTQRQLDYAAADVLYLGGIKQHLEAEIEQKGRGSWLEEECSRLSDSSHYENDPAAAWRRVKGTAKLDPAQLARVGAIAAWRENRARVRNLPRGWVLKDDRIVALARAAPSSKTALLGVDGLAPGLIRRYGEELLDVINGAAAGSGEPNELQLPRLTDAGKSLLQDLLAALRQCAEQQAVSAALIATRRDLEAAVCGRSELRLFEGWRNELFGSVVREAIASRAASALYSEVP